MTNDDSNLNPYATPAISSFATPAALNAILSSFKRRNIRRLILLTLITVVATPVGLGIAGHICLPDLEVAWLAAPFIALATWGVSLPCRYWSDITYGPLGRKLSELLRAEQIDVAAWSGRFVQFAPAGEIRLYDMHSEWDVGYFFLFHDQCTFVGSLTRFSVPRDAIHSVSLGYGSVELPFAYQVRVHWKNPTSNREETFSIWPGVPGSLLNRRPESLEFATSIRYWLASGENASTAPAWANLPIPRLESVESKSLAESYSVFATLLGGIFVSVVVTWLIIAIAHYLDLHQNVWWAISSGVGVILYVLITLLSRPFARDPVRE